MNKTLNTIFLAFSLTIIVLLAWVNYAEITEAFGAGPPYYGQTTNMDKWANPTPYLIKVNLFGIILIIGLKLIIYRIGKKT